MPGPVLVAIWGLESDYGVNQGKFSTIRSLATLAFDCRRSEKFRTELLDALRIAASNMHLIQCRCCRSHCRQACSSRPSIDIRALARPIFPC